MYKQKTGQDIYRLLSKLYPINRSITGSGVRQTLKILQDNIPLSVHEVKSGEKVLDWEVPDEWNIRNAYIADSRGNKIIDFEKSNLHVVNYSVAVDTKLSLIELKKRLYTLPDRPDWIPYKTSYYDKTWGFCIAYNDYKKLKDDIYTVVINSTMENGSLTYGEYYLPGKSVDEILISTHICHPSLANDNLSGIAVAAYLAKYVQSLKKRKFSYRFLFVPGTIGALSWLSLNRTKIGNIVWGLVLTGLGDSGNLTYKKSKLGNSEVDASVQRILKDSGKQYKIVDFYPFGYDERQYSAVGFNIPTGLLMRSMHGAYPQYHTSADNLDFVSAKRLGEALKVCRDLINSWEKEKFYSNNFPYGEPQLGKRGIYQAMNDVSVKSKNLQMAILWVLSLSDGKTSLTSIAKRAGNDYKLVSLAAEILQSKKIISLK